VRVVLCTEAGVREGGDGDRIHGFGVAGEYEGLFFHGCSGVGDAGPAKVPGEEQRPLDSSEYLQQV